MNKFMETAVREARIGMESGDGGPFGAVIVNRETGEVVASTHNMVLCTNDPTMHAEVAAIRAATAKLGRFSLHDCEIYSSCMPCPMCLSAIMWAKIPTLYYGATAKDAAEAGFDDDYIYRFIRNDFKSQDEESKLTMSSSDEETCRELFAEWKKMNGKSY